MLDTLLVSILTIVFVFVYYASIDKMTYVRATVNNSQYLVNNIQSSDRAANILATIDEAIKKIIKYKDEPYAQDDEMLPYLKTLAVRYPNTILCENDDLSPDANLTSYSVNKGDKIVMCLRNPNNVFEFIDTNTVLYVALHEVSHIACPEIGHTDLFKRIFVYFLLIGIKLNVYTYVPYNQNPAPYCGITVDENLLVGQFK